MGTLQSNLNRCAGTSGFGAARAANLWAGTTGLGIVKALNIKAGTTGLGLQAVCNVLAGGTKTDGRGVDWCADRFTP